MERPMIYIVRLKEHFSCGGFPFFLADIRRLRIHLLLCPDAHVLSHCSSYRLPLPLTSVEEFFVLEKVPLFAPGKDKNSLVCFQRRDLSLCFVWEPTYPEVTSCAQVPQSWIPGEDWGLHWLVDIFYSPSIYLCPIFLHSFQRANSELSLGNSFQLVPKGSFLHNAFFT